MELTPKQARAVELKQKGLTYKEIGKEFGCSQQNAIRLVTEGARKMGNKFMFRKNKTLSWGGNGQGV